MKSFILLSLLVTVVTAHPLENSSITKTEKLDFNSSSNRIVNGELAALGQFPHQALILNMKRDEVIMCGGSLICDSWVLTAAHCAVGRTTSILRFGIVDQEEPIVSENVVVHTAPAIVHPEYVPKTFENDVALINLERNLPFTETIQPIPLKVSSVPKGVQLTVSGWGKTSDESDTSRYLRHAAVDSISNTECMKYFSEGVVFDSMLCCKGRPHHGSCGGDSGGPLTQYTNNHAVLVGVVSFGAPSGCTTAPSVNARVSHYIDWIERTTKGSCSISKV